MRSFSFLMCEYFQEVVCVQNSRTAANLTNPESAVLPTHQLFTHSVCVCLGQEQLLVPHILSSVFCSAAGVRRSHRFVLKLPQSVICLCLWWLSVAPVQGQDTHWQSCLVTGVAVTVTGISDLSCHVHGTIFRPSEVAARLSDTPFVSHIPTGWSFTSSSVSLSHFVFLYLFMSTNAGQLQDFLCLLLRLYNWVQTGHGHLSPLTHTDTHTRTDRQIVKYSSVNM